MESACEATSLILVALLKRYRWAAGLSHAGLAGALATASGRSVRQIGKFEGDTRMSGTASAELLAVVLDHLERRIKRVIDWRH
jgi:hypothetical protein